MDTELIVQIVQAVSGVLLIVSILMTRSEAGVGGAFGGGEVSDSAGVKRRGAEKILFIITIVLSLTFVGSMVVPLLL